jgi:hypothetical protein
MLLSTHLCRSTGYLSFRSVFDRKIRSRNFCTTPSQTLAMQVNDFGLKIQNKLTAEELKQLKAIKAEVQKNEKTFEMLNSRIQTLSLYSGANISGSIVDIGGRGSDN